MNNTEDNTQKYRLVHDAKLVCDTVENNKLMLRVKNSFDGFYSSKYVFDTDLKQFKNCIDLKNFIESCNNSKDSKNSYEITCNSFDEIGTLVHTTDSKFNIKLFTNVFNVKIEIENFEIKYQYQSEQTKLFDKLKNLKIVFSNIILEMKELFEQIALEESKSKQVQSINNKIYKKMIEEKAVSKLKQQFFTQLMQFKEDDDSVTQDDYMLVDNYVQKENQENKKLQTEIVELKKENQENKKLQTEIVELKEENKQLQDTIVKLKKDVADSDVAQSLFNDVKYLFTYQYKMHNEDVDLSKYVLIEKDAEMIDFTNVIDNQIRHFRGYSDYSIYNKLHGLYNLKKVKFFNSTLPIIFSDAKQYIFDDITDIEIVMDGPCFDKFCFKRMNNVTQVTFNDSYNGGYDFVYFVKEFKKNLPAMKVFTLLTQSTNSYQLAKDFCKENCITFNLNKQ